MKRVPEHEQLFVLWAQTRGRDGGKRGCGGVRIVKVSVPTAEILLSDSLHFLQIMGLHC